MYESSEEICKNNTQIEKHSESETEKQEHYSEITQIENSKISLKIENELCVVLENMNDSGSEESCFEKGMLKLLEIKKQSESAAEKQEDFSENTQIENIKISLKIESNDLGYNIENDSDTVLENIVDSGEGCFEKGMPNLLQIKKQSESAAEKQEDYSENTQIEDFKISLKIESNDLGYNIENERDTVLETIIDSEEGCFEKGMSNLLQIKKQSESAAEKQEDYSENTQIEDIKISLKIESNDLGYNIENDSDTVLETIVDSGEGCFEKGMPNLLQIKKQSESAAEKQEDYSENTQIENIKISLKIESDDLGYNIENERDTVLETIIDSEEGCFEKGMLNLLQMKFSANINNNLNSKTKNIPDNILKNVLNIGNTESQNTDSKLSVQSEWKSIPEAKFIMYNCDKCVYAAKTISELKLHGFTEHKGDFLHAQCTSTTKRKK